MTCVKIEYNKMKIGKCNGYFTFTFKKDIYKILNWALSGFLIKLVWKIQRYFYKITKIDSYGIKKFAWTWYVLEWQAKIQCLLQAYNQNYNILNYFDLKTCFYENWAKTRVWWFFFFFFLENYFFCQFCLFCDLLVSESVCVQTNLFEIVSVSV